MGKKRNTRMTIAKQNALAEKQKKAKLNKILKISISSVVAVVLVTALVVTIVLASRPYYASIEVEGYGTIVVKLDKSEAPITVKNFVSLAESGFYDGLTFHRIIEGFMMQGGCPKGNGTGGADKDIKGEFSANGVSNNITHDRGVISMARGDEYDSGSSQFFIVHKDYPSLDGKYAAFGHVVSGMEIVDKICEEAEPTDKNGTIPKDKQPKIVTITIAREWNQ